MKTIQRGTDLMIWLALNFDPKQVKDFSIKYFTHLDEEHAHVVTLADGIIKSEGTYLALLPSQELDKVGRGQLVSIVTITREDFNFPDKNNNENIKQFLDIWLK